MTWLGGQTASAVNWCRSRLAAGFGRNVALLIGSTALGQVAVLATLPLVSRLYRPDDMGRLGAFMSFLGTASVVTALRYDIMIVAAVSEAEGIALLAGVCLVTIPLSLAASAILAGLIQGRLLGFEVLPWAAVLWMFPALVVTQLFFTLRYSLMRDGAFPLIARVTVGQNAARAAGPVVLFPVMGSWLGLLAGELLGRGLGITSMLSSKGTQLRTMLRSVRIGEIVRAFAAYPESLYAGTPSALINAASNYLPLPLIAEVYGVAAAGYFGIVQRGLQIPVALIARNVADVFHARLADHGRAGSGGARRLFWRTGGMLLLVGGVPSLFLVAFGPALTRLVLGPRWDPASMLLVAMIPWTLASFVVSPLSRAVVVYRGQVQKLLYDVVSIIAVWMVIAMAKSLEWSLLHTVWVMSWSQAATYVLYLGILVRMIPAGASDFRGMSR